MFSPSRRLALILNCFIGLVTFTYGETLSIAVRAPAPPVAEGFHLGTPTRPDGTTLTVDSASFLRNGHPFIPVMGEFHYGRYPQAEWRDELLKMKAGGLTVVATYVFWIYHEEVEGQWNWSGQRNLREFVREAGEVGLDVVVRCGPWCHGEVRNGGLPEWLVRKGVRLRTTDEAFLTPVRELYAQIATQLRGELWKDGGPVIGIQLDNEFPGPAEYLLTLKKIARDAGLDVPIYTRTGWPALSTPMPFGEIVPLYGAYAEGFWDRELTKMPGKFWSAFRFSNLRVDDNIATEQLGRRDTVDAPDVDRYPYLTCEVGGGMISSYHRRMVISPEDVESTVMIKLGSGSTLPGYYMYHGGTNPDARLTTLMEAQGTLNTNYNDLPVKNYDYGAPLGEFAQVNPHYHLLRRLHLFLADFGEGLARMPATMPDVRPGGPDDHSTLRWTVRSDGKSGYVFVNNYERGHPMPVKPGVQFAIGLPGGTLTFPRTPVDVPADGIFIWPFNLDLGGVRLDYATAQLVCSDDDGTVRTVFFAATPGVPARFAIAGEKEERVVTPGRGVAFALAGANGRRVQFVVLSDADSLALWKDSGQPRNSGRVFLSKAGLMFDGKRLRLRSTNRDDLAVEVFAGTGFSALPVTAPATSSATATAERVRKAGPPREIPLGKISEPVATEPDDADFAQAAVWRIHLPAAVDLATDPILRLHYQGDVARITLDGHLLDDNFYDGNSFDLGLRRYAPAILKGELEVEILPLRKDAVSGPKQRIYVPAGAVPDFGAADSVASVSSVEIVPRYEAEVPLPTPR
ncbi:MAG TPA: beta-galactosidase [Candidatus Didemnitutus sp.]|nr:beta-galactosidase [Candidatus Didemnitutus sp.]